MKVNLCPPCVSAGYVQSLIRRVVNNLNVVINNLILKYVEDDIVLSVNITSAECYTVDEQWDRAFIDITCEFPNAAWLCIFSCFMMPVKQVKSFHHVTTNWFHF